MYSPTSALGIWTDSDAGLEDLIANAGPTKRAVPDGIPPPDAVLADCKADSEKAVPLAPAGPADDSAHGRK